MVQTARVDVPKLGRLQKAQSFQQLQNNLDNDTFWKCIGLFKSLSGVSINPTAQDVERHWPAFSEMIDAISAVLRLLSYAFGYLEITLIDTDQRSDSRIRQLREWLNLQPDGFENQFSRRLTVSVLEAIETGMWISSTHNQMSREVDVFVLHIANCDESHEVPESDVFISYKHAVYFELASQLNNSLKSKGMACWLDREKLGLREGERLDPKFLRMKLKEALQSARCTVFFETYDLATVDSNFRGEHVAYNWQEFEQRFANSLLIVRPAEGTIFEGASHGSWRFIGIEGLAELIVKRLSGYERQPRALHRATKETEPLGQCMALLAKLGNEYFRRDITISQRAALILLVPGGIRLREELIYSDDVLINLMRYSPYCAFEMMKAGMDILSLMRVGVKLRDADWGQPGSCLFEDFLGTSVIGKVDVVDEIENSGYLDETRLLAGLLQFAASGGTFVNRLLTKTFNLMRGQPPEEPASQEIETLRDRVIHSLRQRNYRYQDQQWTILFDGDRVRLRPFACCGIFKIAGLRFDEVVSVRLHVAQINTFFSCPAFKAFEDLLNADSTATALNAFFETTAELRETMSASSPMYIADIFEMTGSNEPPGHFFLELARAIQELPRNGTSSSLALRLLDAVSHLRCQPNLAQETADESPFSFNYRRRAIIIGTLIEELSSYEDPPISLIDLQVTTLSQLWQYQQARNLEYDDI